jgi:hypothetical protein
MGASFQHGVTRTERMLRAGGALGKGYWELLSEGLWLTQQFGRIFCILASLG